VTSPRTPHAIIFDLDGTLVDTVGTRVDSWMAVFPDFLIHPDPAFLAPLMGSDGRLLARMTAERYGVELAPGDDGRIDQAAGAKFRELNSTPRPLPAARKVLEDLTAAGVPWAVATSSRPEDARQSVAALELSTEATVCDGADVEHAKPAPDLLLKAARILEVEPTEAWYVGDSRWDMLAAASAGMRPVAVLTGATPGAELVETGADAVYPTLDEFDADLRGVLAGD
jgi:HAD superfamily hydrolase (TIGR01509 family)